MDGAEIYSGKDKTWVPLRRGQFLRSDDKIRTGPGIEVDLQVPDQIQMRLKENSELTGQGGKIFDKETTYRLQLLKGRILGSTEKGFEKRRMEISTPVLVAAVRGTQFQVGFDAVAEHAKVEVLRGSVEVRSLRVPEVVIVKGLQKTEVSKKGAPSAPVQVTREEWDQLKEAYELSSRSALLEAQQLDLSRKAGSLFNYVFDHGTFYTPDMGFADREFFQEKTGLSSYLQLKYDVFPAYCYVGMYMKIRDLDLAKFKSVSFDARGDEEEGWPDEFRIEVKTKNGIVAAFTVKDLKPTWRSYQFPIRLSRSAMVTEMTVVISNVKVGSNKKGSVYFRNFNLNA